MEQQIARVTPRIYLGPFLTEARAEYLRALGVRNALNVGEAPSIIKPGDFGFVVIRDVPIEDLAPIPLRTAEQALSDLRQLLLVAPECAYVHCIAGRNRSPTIVWLYLVAAGASEAEARDQIESVALDAVPGHKSLVQQAHVELAHAFGSRFPDIRGDLS